mgnify:CR=1 FL=1
MIYLSISVPNEFVKRLKGFGATVVIEGKDYESSMDAAQIASEKNGWILLSDVTWDGYEGGIDVMEGYLVMPHEAVKDWEGDTPTHVFLQTGCGGLAAAVTAYLRKTWGNNCWWRKNGNFAWYAIKSFVGWRKRCRVLHGGQRA